MNEEKCKKCIYVLIWNGVKCKAKGFRYVRDIEICNIYKKK